MKAEDPVRNRDLKPHFEGILLRIIAKSFKCQLNVICRNT